MDEVLWLWDRKNCPLKRDVHIIEEENVRCLIPVGQRELSLTEDIGDAEPSGVANLSWAGWFICKQRP